MFGESDSESPRVPSPWDSLASTPPSPRQIPKLVPEAEEGNVEYKLQLLSPSPARFARLVTQLKWRLLEGGGQAYYELGVADSGTLVGLPRPQLEESLETLEMMAGEIGASVIVVKEIEVPPELSSIAESQLERWGGKSSASRRDVLRMRKQDDDSPTEEHSHTDVEEHTCYSPSSGGSPIPMTPFSDSVAIFTPDGEEDFASYADVEAQDDDPSSDCFPISLEIASVYKPRPMKKRATHLLLECTKKRRRNGYLPSKPAQDIVECLPQPCGAKSQHRRDKRGKPRENTIDTLPIDGVSPGLLTGPLTNSVDHQTRSADELSPLVPDSPHAAAVNPPAVDTTGTASKDPRLIVEALVVRKMSLDEVFLDFEGFSLQ